MFERLFDSTAIPLLANAAAFTQARHRAILSNIANAETPGYIAQDVAAGEFEEQLGRAAEAHGRGAPFALRSSSHNRVTGEGVEFKAVVSPAGGPMKANGNNVSLELEAIALLKNTMRHNSAVELMRKQFSLIEAAIRERV